MNEPADAEILIVEDDPGLRQLLVDEISDFGYGVTAADSLQAALAKLQTMRALLVVSDLRLPDGTGLQVLEASRQLSPPPAFIVITAFGTVSQAVDALKRGADDFLTKPLDFEHLHLTIARVIENQRLRQEVAYYRQFVGKDEFHGMIGRSRAMQTLFEQIRMVAVAEGPVLITGESGTGKELVARAIHQQSHRSDHEFVAVNCGGLPANLLESELFGHVAGAFTGAKNRTGLFASANKGTLLLDEIGEMPLDMQSALLRLLEGGRVRPVGSNQEREMDVRIIAATNRNLSEDVADRRFREDLFYRLETFTIEVPPLRQREGDIERLVAHLIQHFSQRQKRPLDGIEPEALAVLCHYHFPGNVRELFNIIERAVTFCRGATIGLEELPPRLRNNPMDAGWVPPADTAALLPLEAIEKAYVQHVMGAVGGNKRQAAQILGVSRRTLYRWLDEN
ncbi:MAG TPA: sigma-54 dependent transcriptional regulator [Marinagarivorans sp.]